MGLGLGIGPIMSAGKGLWDWFTAEDIPEEKKAKIYR